MSSPARDALMNNLVAAIDDESLTLQKKRSWMAGLRDIVSKGALQAKTAVDSFRGGQQQAESQAECGELRKDAEADDPLSSPERRSYDSGVSGKAATVSSTTSLRPKHDRQRSLASRIGTASLRKHLRNHSYGHNQRSSVYSILPESSNDIERDTASTGDLSATPSPQARRPALHHRHDSITKSIVGSIWGMGRRSAPDVSMSMPGIDSSEATLSKHNQKLSLPINIPVPPPALQLDLGPAGFSVSPPRFLPLNTPTPDNTPRGKRDQPFLCSKTEAHRDDCLQTRRTDLSVSGKPVRPRDILKLEFGTDDLSLDLKPLSGPPTPMPGTNMPLELDGANSRGPAVFERSVTPPTAEDRKWLRPMASLDALAEACTIAHCEDEITAAVAPPPTPNERFTKSIALSALGKMRMFSPNSMDAMATAATIAHRIEELDHEISHSKEKIESVARPTMSSTVVTPYLPPRRNFASAETVQSLPSEMPTLSRQWANEMLPSDDLALEDPFADAEATSSGPPSPTRSVTLPFRPKLTLDTAHLPAANTSEGDSNAASDGSDASNFYLFSPNAPTSPIPLDVQMDLQRSYDLSEFLAHTEDSQMQQAQPEAIDPFEHPASDDDTSMRAKELYATGLILPDYNYDGTDSMSHEDGMSPHGGPLAHVFAPQSAEGNTLSPTSEETQHEFNINNWLRTADTADAPKDQPAPATPRRTDTSTDSSSTDQEREMPRETPNTGSPDRTPSMGNRVEFELKRSHRNARYNALHQPISATRAHDDVPPTRSSWYFTLGGSEDTADNDIQLAEFGTAYNAKTSNHPPESAAMETRIDSEESVSESLRNAAYDYGQLAEQLEDCQDPFQSPDDYPAASQPEQGAMAWAEQTRRYAISQQGGRTGPVDAAALAQPLKKDSTPSSVGACISDSSTDSKLYGAVLGHEGERVVSGDTLDAALALYDRKDSGYLADGDESCEET